MVWPCRSSQQAWETVKCKEEYAEILWILQMYHICYSKLSLITVHISQKYITYKSHITSQIMMPEYDLAYMYNISDILDIIMTLGHIMLEYNITDHIRVF